MACLSTQLQRNVNKVLEDTLGFSECNSPEKYNLYCKIRRELSRVMGKSRSIGVIEYEKGMKRLLDIKEQLEVSGVWK